MSKDQRKGWLLDLEVGSKVIEENVYNQRIVTVDKITPTGRIVCGNSKFDASGRAMGSNYSYGSFYLAQYTDEAKDAIIIKKHIMNIETTIHKTLNTDGLISRKRRLNQLDLEKVVEFSRYINTWAESCKEIK